MKSISITPGKNNVGAYINDVNLNKLNRSENDIENYIWRLNYFGWFWFDFRGFLASAIYQNGYQIRDRFLEGLKVLVGLF